MGQKQQIGVATPEKIEEWKKKYPKGIYRLDSETGHVAYFRNPDRADINMALGMMTTNPATPLDGPRAALEATMIGGSEDVLNDDPIFLGAVTAFREKMEGAKVTLVNL